MKKKILSIVLMSAILLTIVGCGGSQTQAPAGENASTASNAGNASTAPSSGTSPAASSGGSGGTSAASPPPSQAAPSGAVGIGDWLYFEGPLDIKHVGFSMETVQTDFAAALVEAVVEEIEKRGWTYEMNEANNDPMRQLAQCEDMIAKGIDALILKPLDENSFAPISQLCLEENIPLIVPNTFLNSPYTMAALADQYNNGVICANLLIERNPGTIHKTLLLRGPLAMESFNLRAQGAIDTLEAAGYEILYQVSVNNRQDEGLTEAENFISTGVEFDSILCGADSMAIGAAIAVEEAGLADQVYVFGNGGQIEAAENLIMGGQLDGTIFLTPAVYVTTVFEAFDKLIAGQPYEQRNMVNVAYMGPDNVYDFYPELKP